MKLLLISCSAVISSSKLGTLKGDGGTFYFPAQTTQKPIGEFQAWFHFFTPSYFYRSFYHDLIPRQKIIPTLLITVCYAEKHK